MQVSGQRDEFAEQLVRPLVTGEEDRVKTPQDPLRADPFRQRAEGGDPLRSCRKMLSKLRSQAVIVY